MGFIWMAIVGLAVGALAKYILPGKDPGGILVTMLIGIGGTYLGFFLRGIIMNHDAEFSVVSPRDWLFSLGGAILILVIWKKLIAPMFAKADSNQ